MLCEYFSDYAIDLGATARSSEVVGVVHISWAEMWHFHFRYFATVSICTAQLYDAQFLESTNVFHQ